MEQRALGTQGLVSSAIGYGAMDSGLGDSEDYDATSRAAIRRAREIGVTHFDTAALYGWGKGERLLGSALAPIREHVTIATKFGFPPGFVADSRPERIGEVLDRSLRNLGIDTIDVLYQHIDDPAIPIEEVVVVMKGLVEKGKVRYLGLLNTTPENLRRAHAVHPISVLQASYSLFDRSAEAFFPLLEQLGVGLVAYRPIARGFLGGKVVPLADYPATDFRHRNPWWSPENFEANRTIAHKLTLLAEGIGITLSQLALSWLLARKPYIVPIPGTRDTARVEENSVASSVRLTDSDLRKINLIAPNGAYPRS